MKENTSLTPLPTFPLPAFYLISPSGSFLHYKKKEKKKLPFTPQVRHLFPMLQPAVTPFLVCKISMSILLFCMFFFSITVIIISLTFSISVISQMKHSTP